jgi:hypothetical protein
VSRPGNGGINIGHCCIGVKNFDADAIPRSWVLPPSIGTVRVDAAEAFGRAQRIGMRMAAIEFPRVEPAGVYSLSSAKAEIALTHPLNNKIGFNVEPAAGAYSRFGTAWMNITFNRTQF